MKSCDICGDEFSDDHSGKIKLGMHRRKEHGILGQAAAQRAGTSPADKAADPDDETGDGAEPEEPPASPYDAVEPETAPSPQRRQGLGTRIRAWGRGRRGGQSAPASARPTGETRPRRATSKRRIPLDDDISDVWGFLGRRLERGPHYPTGRMLQFTGLAAGTIIDDGVAGTLPDRVLFQPIVRTRSRWEPVLVIVGLPIVTYRITNVLMALDVARKEGDTDQAAVLDAQLAMLTEAFDFLAEQGLPLLAPGVEKARLKAEKQRAAMAQAFPELGLDGTISAADALRRMLFEQPPGTVPGTEPGPEEGQDDGIGNREAFSSAFGADTPGAVA